MMRVLNSLILLILVEVSLEQASDFPLSPCPKVFSYESQSSNPERWYGVVNLSTDSTLYSLWLNIVLDSKADILGNWVGDVTTTNNIDFKIENTKMKIEPGPATAVKFFVQYNALAEKAPKLVAIRLNGREICNANTPHPVLGRPGSERVPDVSDNEESRRTTSYVQNSPTSPPSVVRPDNSHPVQGSVQRPQEGPAYGDNYDRPSTDRAVQTPEVRPADQTYVKPQRPIDGQIPVDRPVQRPSRPIERPNAQPVYVPTQNPPINESHVNPYSINGGQQHNSVNDGYRFTTNSPPRTTTRREYEDFDSDRRPVSSNDYFSGGQPTFVVTNTNPSESHNNGARPSSNRECGKVKKNNPNPLVVNGKPTLEGQWPWQIALYQTQTIDNKYICGGTLVSPVHVITAAHCITRKGSTRIVNPNTLTIYLGKHNLRTSVNGVVIRFVKDITVHPEYNATSFARDLAILVMREPVTYSEWIQPACLWPENQIDLTNVIGKKGSVVGWGFDDKGLPTEELTLVEMPVVKQETCTWSYSEFFARFTSEYTFCAGFRDGTSVCNGDSGGGMVFNLDHSWYLRGLVSLSVARKNDYEYRCDPSHYVVFTDLAKFLPWIQEQISDGHRSETTSSQSEPYFLQRRD